MWAALRGLAGQSLSEDTLAKELTDYAFGRCIPFGKREGNSIRQKIVFFCKDTRYMAVCSGCKLEFPLARACLNLSLILFNVQTD